MKILLTILILTLMMACQPGWAQMRFQKREVVKSFAGPAGLSSGDLDGDSLPDLAAGSASYGIYAMINKLKPTGSWEILPVDDKFGVCLSVFIIDMDNDKANDIVACSWDKGEIAWYRNAGDLAHWTKNTIARNFSQAHEVFVSDMDSDGDLDVLCAGAGNNQIAWWRNDGGNPESWTQQILTNHFMGARSVAASDLDQDGDPEVIGASLTGNEVTIWMNKGGSPISWTEVTLSNSFTGSHRVQVFDMDSDGWTDILATAYAVNTIAWWKNPGSIQGYWTRNTVDINLPGAVIGTAVDLDLDGDPDVVGTAQPGNRVAWYENTGSYVTPWKKTELETSFGGPWPLTINDFDLDGDPDFAVGGNSANEIRWYENIQEGRISRAFISSSGRYPVKVYLPPGVTEKTHAYIALPYQGDPLASNRLRDILTGLSEAEGGIVIVPEFPNLGPPFYTPSFNERLAKTLEIALEMFPVHPDSVYLVGFEANGLESIRSGETDPATWTGIIPFNPLLPSLSDDLFFQYPDLPVCLCSGTLHPDRINHSTLVSRIHRRFGKATLVNLENAADEILVADIIERLVDCKKFIDTVRGGASGSPGLPAGQPACFYPNPASGYLNIDLPFGCQSMARLEIRSSTGMLILSRQIGVGRTLLDLKSTTWKPGIYFVSVHQGNNLWRHKLILNRT